MSDIFSAIQTVEGADNGRFSDGNSSVTVLCDNSVGNEAGSNSIIAVCNESTFNGKNLKRQRDSTIQICETLDGDDASVDSVEDVLEDNERRTSAEKDSVKLRQSSREVSQRITLTVLESYYNMPLTSAAKMLNVSNTMLKKLCRRYRIQRWPHRQIRSIDNEVQKHQDILKNATAPTEAALAEQRIELLRKKRVIVTRTASCGLNASLRSAIFMARPGEIDAEQLFSSGVIPAFQAKSARFDNNIPSLSSHSGAITATAYGNTEPKAARILPKTSLCMSADISLQQQPPAQMHSPAFSVPSGWVPANALQANFASFMPQTQQQNVSNFAGFPLVSHFIPPADANSYHLFQQQQLLIRQMAFGANPLTSQHSTYSDRNLQSNSEGNISRLPPILEYPRHHEEL